MTNINAKINGATREHSISITCINNVRNLTILMKTLTTATMVVVSPAVKPYHITNDDHFKTATGVAPTTIAINTTSCTAGRNTTAATITNGYDCLIIAKQLPPTADTQTAATHIAEIIYVITTTTAGINIK